MERETAKDVALEALARAAQSGDRAALERLARAVYPRVHRWALVYAQENAEAEDITQEALIRIVRGIDSFRFGSRVTTWMYSITRRAAADARRASNRGRALAERVTTCAPADRGQRTHAEEEAVDLARARASVFAHFARLPARQREIFDLADLEGVALTDIAELLGLAPVTVRVHLLRARRALRDRIVREHPAIVEDLYGLPNGT